MNDIIAGDPAPTNPTARIDAAGLRELADWLDANSSRPFTPRQMYVPLHTNAAVAEFAAAEGWPVDYDAEGNASTTKSFGPITYYAYGYVNYDEYAARKTEEQARSWAAEQGLEIAAPAGGDER